MSTRIKSTIGGNGGALQTPVGAMGAMKKAKSIRGIDSAVMQRQANVNSKNAPRVAKVEEQHHHISHHARAHSNLLPMVLESMINGPLIPEYRRFLKILVADADTKNQKFFCDYLTLKGCEVTCADTGPRAIEESKNEDYDIIFIDFSVPDGDGIAVMEVLRDYSKLFIKSKLSYVEEEKENMGSSEDNIESFGPSLSVNTLNKAEKDESFTEPVKQATPDFVCCKEDEYNPHMLIVGMDAYPSDRIDEAVSSGMEVYCPRPFDVHFISSIITTWRNSANKASAIEKIQADPAVVEAVKEVKNDNGADDDFCCHIAEYICCPCICFLWTFSCCEPQVHTEKNR